MLSWEVSRSGDKALRSTDTPGVMWEPCCSVGSSGGGVGVRGGIGSGRFEAITNSFKSRTRFETGSSESSGMEKEIMGRLMPEPPGVDRGGRGGEATGLDRLSSTSSTLRNTQPLSPSSSFIVGGWIVELLNFALPYYFKPHCTAVALLCPSPRCLPSRSEAE